MTDRVANKNCRSYVQQCKPFQGSNLYGVSVTDSKGGDRYVVYSYGTHYPMFIKCGKYWWENSDRYSVSTSKHRSQAHPHTDTVKLSTHHMMLLAEGGYRSLVANRLSVVTDNPRGWEVID